MLTFQFVAVMPVSLTVQPPVPATATWDTLRGCLTCLGRPWLSIGRALWDGCDCFMLGYGYTGWCGLLLSSLCGNNTGIVGEP